ncbi:MAG: RDD family protein [Candidatus Dormibacteria bacterium]
MDNEVITSRGGEIFVATPERVTFNYRLAGIGTRMLAQVIDVIILVALNVVLAFGAVGLAHTLGSSLATVVYIVAAFVLFFGYFWLQEGLWSGKTVGKAALRIRAVGDGGEPMTLTQAGVRNLVRLVDFIPLWYGIGLVTIFAGGSGKRLGDFAAGTLVVRERASLSLGQLVRLAERAVSVSASNPASPDRAAPISRAMDPGLRRFVVAYAARREGLTPERRRALADTAASGLARANPSLFAAAGALAVLDELADRAVG